MILEDEDHMLPQNVGIQYNIYHILEEKYPQIHCHKNLRILKFRCNKKKKTIYILMTLCDTVRHHHLIEIHVLDHGYRIHILQSIKLSTV